MDQPSNSGRSPAQGQRATQDFVPRREARSHQDRLVLWLVVLTGMVAWVLALALSWMLTPSAVHSGSNVRLLVVNVVAAVIVLVAGAVSWYRWRRPGGPNEAVQGETPRETDRFMAELGLISNILFLLVILGQSAAIFVLGPGL